MWKLLKGDSSGQSVVQNGHSVLTSVSNKGVHNRTHESNQRVY